MRYRLPDPVVCTVAPLDQTTKTACLAVALYPGPQSRPRYQQAVLE